MKYTSLWPTRPSQAIQGEEESTRRKGDRSLDAPDGSDWMVRGVGAVCASAAKSSTLHPADCRLPFHTQKVVKFAKDAVSTGPEIAVESWRMNEWKYYDIPSPFQTLVRGLFSVEEKGEGGPRYRIVVRVLV